MLLGLITFMIVATFLSKLVVQGRYAADIDTRDGRKCQTGQSEV